MDTPLSLEERIAKLENQVQVLTRMCNDFSSQIQSLLSAPKPSAAPSPFGGTTSAPSSPEVATVKLGYWCWHFDDKKVLTLGLYTAYGENKLPTITIKTKCEEGMPKWAFIKKLGTDTKTEWDAVSDFAIINRQSGIESWKSPMLTDRSQPPAHVGKMGMIVELRALKKKKEGSDYYEYVIEDFQQAPVVSPWASPSTPSTSENDDIPF